MPIFRSRVNANAFGVALIFETTLDAGDEADTTEFFEAAAVSATDEFPPPVARDAVKAATDLAAELAFIRFAFATAAASWLTLYTVFAPHRIAYVISPSVTY